MAELIGTIPSAPTINGAMSAPPTLNGNISTGGSFSGGVPGMRGLKGDKGDPGDTGETGNGIESAVLNQDYTLTLTFTDGTYYTTPSIRGAQGDIGETGTGITDVTMNLDYTLTITFSDGTTYTTASIRGEKGDTGETGSAGADGYSPMANVSKTGNVATITITDKTGTTTAQVYDGEGSVSDVTQNGTSVLDGTVAKVTVPTKVSDLTNDSGFITTETDPTVPSWAKQSTKPSYAYSEISGTPTLATVATSGDYDDLDNKPTIPTVPTNVSAFTNDAGYLTTETDPTVPSWAKQSAKPSYTASEVGALPSTTSIPSKTSDLTNDSGFLTSHQSIKTINGTSMVGSGDCAVATYSTTDLTAGSSALATGRIYLVYE